MTALEPLHDLQGAARRAVRLAGQGDPAGWLAVIDVGAPEGFDDAGLALALDRVGAFATASGAPAAFDAERGRLVLLLTPLPAPSARAALEGLASELAGLDVARGRHRLRLAVGVGAVELRGRGEALEASRAVEAALHEATGLARASLSERALRLHAGPAVDPGRSDDDGAHPLAPSLPGGYLRRRYGALSATGKAWALVAMSLTLAWVLPFLAYTALAKLAHVDVTPLLFWVVFGSVLLTAATVYAEAFLALRPPPLPAAEPVPYPDASAVIAAYLPNETDTVVDTVRCLLAQDYPGHLQVILAYNTPKTLPIEDELAALAAVEPRLVLLRVADSTSKAQNINAALQITSGAFVGIFDADHRPMPTAFRRAARWINDGVDVVQGRSVVRNGPSHWLARMVAVEFEGIYAVAHPGRSSLHGFGIFGGSNGFWRASVLDRFRMRPDMLTEDIDISIRAVFAGARIVVDPNLTSEELAPLTPLALWSQRIRWSQGWQQVSRRQLARIWRVEPLSLRQRLGASFLLGWREIYPWIAAQMIPILAFTVLFKRNVHVQLLVPLFVLATVYVSAVGPIQALFAWHLSMPELRQRRRWWLQYVLVTGVLFGEFKAHVNRAAHVRELIGDRAWQVTPRTSLSPTSVAKRSSDWEPSVVLAMGRRRGSIDRFVLDLPLPHFTSDAADEASVAEPADLSAS